MMAVGQPNFGHKPKTVIENLAVGVSYPVAYDGAGESNNQTSLTAATYSFLLTLNQADPVNGNNVGSLIIQQCLP